MIQKKPEYLIVIDKKYMLFRDKSFPLRIKQYIYEMDNIYNWAVNSKYRLSFWEHIKACFSKVICGSIAFNYADVKRPFYIE